MGGVNFDLLLISIIIIVWMIFVYMNNVKKEALQCLPTHEVKG